MSRGDNIQSLYSGGEIQRLDGADAWEETVDAGVALSELLKGTLGPMGLDKLLMNENGTVVVTNDGASILDKLDIAHPAARSVTHVARHQRSQIGDGTTSVIVLAGELLDRASDLHEIGIHPTSIARGYTVAAEAALETVRETAIPVLPTDEERLRDVAETVITGKWDEESSAFLARKAVMAVSSIEQNATVDLKRITRKAIPGGTYFDSEVIDGLIINMDTSSTTTVSPSPSVPEVIEDATIALVDDQLTVETATGTGAVSLDSHEGLEELKAYERGVYENQTNRIADTGADVVFCQKSIDDAVRHLLHDAGILAVERTRRDELEKLSRATGALSVGTIDDLTPAVTGRAFRVERRHVGATELAVIEGSKNVEQVSVLLRGGTQHVADETKRVIDGCFYALRRVIEDGTVVPGGGAVETHVAQDLRTLATGISGREQLAVEAFADAIETIPRTLAASRGLDPIDSLLELRTRHDEGAHRVGLSLGSGSICDVVDAGVVEPMAVKERAIASATEAANTLVRVDEIVAVPGDEDADGHAHGHDHDHDHTHGDLISHPDGYPWAIGH